MPCYDPETHEFPIRAAAKINFLTELLCAVGTEMEATGVTIFNEKFQQWFVRHKEMDAKRERRDGLLNNGVGRKDWGWNHPDFAEYVRLSEELRYWDAA